MRGMSHYLNVESLVGEEAQALGMVLQVTAIELGKRGCDPLSGCQVGMAHPGNQGG